MYALAVEATPRTTPRNYSAVVFFRTRTPLVFLIGHDVPTEAAVVLAHADAGLFVMWHCGLRAMSASGRVRAVRTRRGLRIGMSASFRTQWAATARVRSSRVRRVFF